MLVSPAGAPVGAGEEIHKVDSCAQVSMVHECCPVPADKVIVEDVIALEV